jgi:hypothetical protein
MAKMAEEISAQRKPAANAIAMAASAEIQLSIASKEIISMAAYRRKRR